MSGSGLMTGAALNARTVTIPVHPGTPFDYSYATYPPKDPADVLTFKINANAFLVDAQTTISGTPTVVPNSTDLTISGITVAGNAVTFAVAGGTIGQTYGLVLTAQLANGNVLSRTVYLPVIPQFTVGFPPQTVIAIGPAGPKGTTGRGIASVLPSSTNGQVWVVTFTDGATVQIELPAPPTFELTTEAFSSLDASDLSGISNTLLSCLPTSTAGLTDGQWWNNGGVVSQYQAGAGGGGSGGTTTQSMLLLEDSTPLVLEDGTPFLLEAGQ